MKTYNITCRGGRKIKVPTEQTIFEVLAAHSHLDVIEISEALPYFKNRA